MDADLAHQLAVVTGRISAALFVLALLGTAVAGAAPRLWIAFMAGHGVHFAAVLVFALVNHGQGLFPGGVSLSNAGGWPVVFATGALFYALALTALAANRAGPAATPRLRMAGVVATSLIGLMFLATYVPLAHGLGAATLALGLLAAALGAYLARAASGAAR